MVLVGIPLAPIAQVSGLAPPLTPPSQHNAIILSSLESLYPMGYFYTEIKYELARAGYQVTMVKNTAVTFDFLTTQLNNYQVVIWRTGEYVYHHKTYWYVGETPNSATMSKYSSDFSLGWANMNAGVMGIGLEFFNEHFPSGSLSNVKLMVVLASDSIVFGNYFVTAGAKAVISVNGYLPLAFGYVDDSTAALFAGLVSGQTVNEAVYQTVSPYSNTEARDPLDNNYQAPLWYLGNGAETIT
jgi:hypothetical protein